MAGDKLKIRFTFPEDYRDTMEQVFKNEQEKLSQLSKRKGLRGKIFGITGKIWKKRFLYDVIPTFTYEFLSDTEAILEIETGMSFLVQDEKIIIKKLKKYEKVSKGIVKVELIENE